MDVETNADTERLDWLGGDGDYSRLEDVRWMMINDRVDIREAIDHLRMHHCGSGC